MRIGAARLELFLADCDSIKGRRRVARSIIDRVRRRFEVSIADVGDQDDRHRIQLGIALVGVDPRHVDARLDRIASYVEQLGLAELVGEERGVARLDELDGDELDGDEPDREHPGAPAAWLAGEEPR